MIAVSGPVTGGEEIAAIAAVFESKWLGLGSTVYEFEQALSDYLGAGHVVAVNTGTSALHLAFDSTGIGPGDEVILPSITFAAAVQPIVSLGATPVFCESRDSDLWIDLEDVERRITPRTRVVSPCHFAGSPGDLGALYALAENRGLRVVEDAAHAFGSEYGGRKVGAFGDLVCFSFDPIKNITTGEGGAVIVQDPEQAETLRRKRLLGIEKDTWHRYQNKRSWQYDVTSNGYRYHMPNFCAAVGLVQLRKFPGFAERRREIARTYDAAFRDLTSLSVLRIDYAQTVPHIYVVRVRAEARDRFMSHLAGKGVGTAVHYIANHLHPFFQVGRSRSEFPAGAEKLWRELVTIPLHCGLSDDDVELISAVVRDFDESELKR